MFIVVLLRGWMNSLRRAIDEVRSGAVSLPSPRDSPRSTFRSRSCSNKSRAVGSRSGPDRLNGHRPHCTTFCIKVLPGAEVIVVSNREPISTTELTDRSLCRRRRAASYRRLSRSFVRVAEHGSLTAAVTLTGKRSTAKTRSVFRRMRHHILLGDLDHRRGTGWLLLRSRQRRPLAIVSHRFCTSAIPPIRLAAI